MDIPAIRQQIPALQKTVYLNTGWSGPSPRAVMDQVREWMEYENAEGPTARPVLERHRELVRQARGAIAGLINATPEEISLTQNTTEGLNLVVNGIEWHQGDQVITCNLEHPSVLIPAYFLKHRYGVAVKVLEVDPQDDPMAILQRFAAAMTPRTRLLFLSHIQFSCGLRLPAKELANLAHQRGAWILLDGAQAAGHVALDMKDLDCDFYALPGHKWLLGPDGVGGLYVRKELIPELQPSKVGGRAVQSFDRRGGFVPRSEGIEKFELTTTSGPLWAGLIAAIEFLRGIGASAIEERSRALGAYAAEKLAEAPGVTVTSPQHPKTCSGLVTFAVRGREPRAVVESLWERGRVVARPVEWPPGVRFSTAFFNTEGEIDQAVALVGDLAAHP